jgi:hypothetical protein
MLVRVNTKITPNCVGTNFVISLVIRPSTRRATASSIYAMDYRGDARPPPAHANCQVFEIVGVRSLSTWVGSRPLDLAACRALPMLKPAAMTTLAETLAPLVSEAFAHRMRG